MSQHAHIGFNPRRHFSKWIKIGLPVFALMVLWVMHEMVPIIFTSLMVSVGLYYILHPAVDWLETRSMRRSFACVVVLVGVAILIASVVMRFTAFSADIRAQLDVDVFQKNLVRTITQMLAKAEEEIPFLKRIIEPKAADPLPISSAAAHSSPPGGHHSKKAQSPEAVPAVPVKLKTLSERIDEKVQMTMVEVATYSAKKVAGLLPNLILIPYFTFFFLKDGRSFRKKVIEWIPNRYFEPGLKFFYELDRRMRSYLQSLLLDCVLVGVLVAVGCTIMGVPYPVIMGVIAFMLNSIPLLGPLLYGTIGLLITIGLGQPPDVVFGYLGIFLFSRVCDDLVFVPTIYGKSSHLHPVMVVIAVLVGESVAGVWGMFLCIPVLSIILLGLGIIREISRGEDPEPLPTWAFAPFA